MAVDEGAAEVDAFETVLFGLERGDLPNVVTGNSRPPKKGAGVSVTMVWDRGDIDRGEGEKRREREGGGAK